MPFLGTRGAGSNRAFGYAGAAKPNQVTGLTATDFGTSRAYNNGRIDLSWTAPGNNGATISGYLIQRSTDNSNYSTLVANTGSSSTTYSDTSLTSSQIYYYKVSAINAAGTGDSSTAASATATTVPQAPTIGTAADGGTGTTATVTYTANATGGKAVSAYTATSSPGSLTGTGASPITVSGLTAGTAYTFTVTATNANGTSLASAASNSVTPVVPGDWDFVAQSTATGVSSVTFSSLPSTYNTFIVQVYGTTATAGFSFQALRINGVTSYRQHRTYTYYNGSTGVFDGVGTGGAGQLELFASFSDAPSFAYWIVSNAQTSGIKGASGLGATWRRSNKSLNNNTFATTDGSGDSTAFTAPVTSLTLIFDYTLSASNIKVFGVK